MKQFIKDEVTNPNGRAMKIAEIKKLVPDFNAEDKSDDYIAAFHDAITVTTSKGEEKEQEQEKEKEEKESSKETEKQASKDQSIIAENKKKRLNMKGK